MCFLKFDDDFLLLFMALMDDEEKRQLKERRNREELFDRQDEDILQKFKISKEDQDWTLVALQHVTSFMFVIAKMRIMEATLETVTGAKKKWFPSQIAIKNNGHCLEKQIINLFSWYEYYQWKIISGNTGYIVKNKSISFINGGENMTHRNRR